MPVTLSGGPPPTPEDFRYWAQREHLGEQSLVRLRASSEGWRNALSLSSGVLAGATLIATTLGLDGRQPPTWLVICGLIAGLLVLAAVVVSARATVGWPRLARDNERPRVWQARETRRTLVAFRWSIWLAAVGGTAAIAVAAGALIAEVKIPVRVELTNGSAVCAHRVDSSGTWWRLSLDEGATRLVRKDDVTAFSSESC